MSFGGRLPFVVLKLLIVATFVAAVVVLAKRCSGVNVPFGGRSPFAVLKLLIVAIFVVVVVVVKRLRCWQIIICSLQAGAAGGGGNTCCRGRGECTMCDVG